MSTKPQMRYAACRSRPDFLRVLPGIAAWHVLPPSMRCCDPTPTDYYNVSPEAVEAWRQWKFGLHMQWNMSSPRGGEIGWSRGGRRWGLEWTGTGEVPSDEYDEPYKQFRAEKFDARELCQILEDSGMRYGTYCAKHHDGFCMWDTGLADYRITNPLCPVGRDLAREWAAACRSTGLKFSIYFSQPDWHHPDYLRSPEAHSRFIKTLHGWVRELCTKYGTVDQIDFDGLGGLARNWDSENLFKMIRKLQPDSLISMRCGAYDVDYSLNDWPVNRIHAGATRLSAKPLPGNLNATVDRDRRRSTTS